LSFKSILIRWIRCIFHRVIRIDSNHSQDPELITTLDQWNAPLGRAVPAINDFKKDLEVDAMDVETACHEECEGPTQIANLIGPIVKNEIICPMCRTSKFRVIKTNETKSKTGKLQKRDQPDRATWLRHLMRCPCVVADMQHHFHKNCIVKFLKLANVTTLDSGVIQHFPCELQGVANLFKKHWNTTQEICFEAITDTKIAKYLNRFRKNLLVEDKIETESIHFVKVSPHNIIKDPLAVRVCVVVLLKENRRARKHRDYSEAPSTIERFIQNKLALLRNILGINFEFKKMANGTYQQKTLIVPFELRLQRPTHSSPLLEHMVKIIKEITIPGLHQRRFRFYLVKSSNQHRIKVLQQK